MAISFYDSNITNFKKITIKPSMLLVDGLSTDYSGRPVANIIDNDSNTLMYPLPSDTHIININFSNPTNVSGYSFLCGLTQTDANPFHWEFSGSNIGGNNEIEWNIIDSFSYPLNNKNWGVIYQKTFNQRCYQYYRLKFLNCNSIGINYHGYISIEEFALYGLENIFYTYIV